MPQYSIGIDLGTTNCALAFREISGEGPVEVAEIPQLVSPNEIAPEKLLPSFLFIPGERDFPPGSIALPWDANPKYVVGKLAQRRGAEVSTRLVSSAKSWLPFSTKLPWNAPEGIARISPVEASAEYLKHLRQAWSGNAPFDEQDILITVPASFDALARDLTGKAAELAGYKSVTMLEEPQAAFYAWIERHPDWRERIHPGDLVLVVDIGGGTTDFSLIGVTEKSGELRLERIAVGEHILLGGDNIDLALAHTVAAQLPARLDSLQMQQLWNNCRLAKEKLLNSDAEELPVTILGKGSSLIGGTIKTRLRREQVEQVLEGFFPRVAKDSAPERGRRAGLQEMGLPYAADAAITRHLAKFLQQPGGFAAPTHVLFNGGVMYAAFARDRIMEVLNGWLRESGKPAAESLTGEDLMHAVARGAAYYGAARHGKGIRIRGGIPRSYYVGIETSMPAVPGIPAPVKALAVAQFGMEEGTSVQ
ncbi:MAG TPA: Hsp70 family protein, partial [Bryobacteraceae bacterium]|nr:Hsp70 family protein [Bryobacteraceae bacterium]